MKEQRKRINITLPAVQYLAVEALALKGGFKGVCPFVRALLSDVAGYALRCEMSIEEKARQPTTIAEEIAEMFKDLESLDAAGRSDGTTIIEIHGRKQ